MNLTNIGEYTEKALTISTGHITKDTADWLQNIVEGKIKSTVIVYEKKPYGWFVSTSSAYEGNIPADLTYLIGLALGSGHDWLQLDRDAKNLQGLTRYNW